MKTVEPNEIVYRYKLFPRNKVVSVFGFIPSNMEERGKDWFRFKRKRKKRTMIKPHIRKKVESFTGTDRKFYVFNEWAKEKSCWNVYETVNCFFGHTGKGCIGFISHEKAMTLTTKYA